MFTRIAQLFVTLLALGTLSVASAQKPGQAPMKQSSGGADIEVTDQQVQQFAELQKEMRGIKQEYRGKMKSQGKSRELKEQMNADVKQAIKDVGLTPKEYKQIAMAARQDKDLRKDIKQAMQ